MRGQIPQDHERLAPQLDLRAVPEESLVPYVEPERAEAANFRTATIRHGQATVGANVSLREAGTEIEAPALRDGGADAVVENIGRLSPSVGCCIAVIEPIAVYLSAV